MDAKEELIELVKANPEICDALLELLHEIRRATDEE